MSEASSSRVIRADGVLELSMVNSTDDMQRLLDEVDVFLESVPASPRRKYGVRLALDELLSNIVKYAYADEAVHRVAVRIETGAPFVLEIADDGRPFNPVDDAPAPVLEGPVEDRPIGSLGLHMLRSLGMRMIYRRENGQNVLRAVFPDE